MSAVPVTSEPAELAAARPPRTAIENRRRLEQLVPVDPSVERVHTPVHAPPALNPPQNGAVVPSRHTRPATEAPATTGSLLSHSPLQPPATAVELP